MKLEIKSIDSFSDVEYNPGMLLDRIWLLYTEDGDYLGLGITSEIPNVLVFGIDVFEKMAEKKVEMLSDMHIDAALTTEAFSIKVLDRFAWDAGISAIAYRILGQRRSQYPKKRLKFSIKQ